MKKENTFEKIQSGMIENEKSLLKIIKTANKENRGWYFRIYGTKTEWNTLERLKEKGKVKWKKSSVPYVSGYWISK